MLYYRLSAPGKAEDGPYLAHYQVKGAVHGVRRYQNLDGSLTPLGRIHYGVGAPREAKNAKSTGKITVNGKEVDVRGDLANIKSKLQEVSARRRQRAVEKQLAKDAIKKDKEEQKEALRQAEEAKKELTRQAEEAAAADREKMQREALKRYFRDHPLQIMSARDILTADEINEVSKQIDFDRKLKDIRRNEIQSYVRTAKDVVDVLDTAYKGADDLRKLYNIGAETYNAFVADKDPNDNKNRKRLIGQGQLKTKPVSTKDNNKSGPEPKKVEKQAEQPKEKAKNNKNSGGSSEQQPKEKENKPKNEKPKYEAKVDLGGGETRYFYDKDEYKAYKDNKGLADKAVNAYSKKSAQERSQFISDLNDRLGDLEKGDKFTGTVKGKAEAILDAIADYDSNMAGGLHIDALSDNRRRR